ncbi:hypothetical protein D3C78_1066680 [compost metagenome]
MQWQFDQAENVAALTTRQVIEDKRPILRVVHYSDDHSWAFTCDSTSDGSDLRVVGMGEIVSIDSTLTSIANLEPGWGASRETVGGEWHRHEV